MSLLEDVFLEDEAGEAQELERIIEGDEYDERPRDQSDSDKNSEKEDEAEEDRRRVDPASTKSKRVTKNPRFVLNPARLTGPRGIQVIPEHFKDFKFKGKGHEKEDLDIVLKKLEHWAYRLYPKFQFADCLKKIETLGKKRPVMVHLHKIRSDQLLSEETVVQKDSSDDEDQAAPPQEEDEFDKLLQQQIDLARTPGPGSVRKPDVSTPLVDKRPTLLMPKVSSSPSISDEQKERMIRNRKLAEERRLAKLHAANNANSKNNSISNENDATVVDSTNVNVTRNENNPTLVDLTEINIARNVNYSTTVDLTNVNVPIIENDCNMVDLMDVTVARKENDFINVDLTDINVVNKNRKTQNTRSNVIDSSDEDNDTTEGQPQNKIVTNNIINIDEEDQFESIRKRSKSNIIESSDDECEEATANHSITIEVHDMSLRKVDKDAVALNNGLEMNTGELDQKKDDLEMYQSVSNYHKNRDSDDDDVIDTNNTKEIGTELFNKNNDDAEMNQSENTNYDNNDNLSETDINNTEKENLAQQHNRVAINSKDIEENVHLDGEVKVNSEQVGKESEINNVLKNDEIGVEDIMDVDFDEDF